MRFVDGKAGNRITEATNQEQNPRIERPVFLLHKARIPAVPRLQCWLHHHPFLTPFETNSGALFSIPSNPKNGVKPRKRQVAAVSDIFVLVSCCCGSPHGVRASSRVNECPYFVRASAGRNALTSCGLLQHGKDALTSCGPLHKGLTCDATLCYL